MSKEAKAFLKRLLREQDLQTALITHSDKVKKQDAKKKKKQKKQKQEQDAAKIEDKESKDAENKDKTDDDGRKQANQGATASRSYKVTPVAKITPASQESVQSV